MEWTERSRGGRDQRALYDLLGVLVMVGVVLLVVGAMGLYVMA